MKLEGHVLTPEGWVRGSVTLVGERVGAVAGTPVSEPEARADRTRALLLPGFVDLHVHGGGGADVMDGGAAVATVARMHARSGTTAWLATTMTAPLPELEATLRALAPSCTRRTPGTAQVLGVHLEGPYISAERLGAQPDFTRALALDELRALMALAPIRVVTLAPEAAGSLALIPALVAAGLRVQIGHSAASYEEASAALDCGASGFTHLFNAMTALHHRAPGVAGAALAHAQHAEIIADLEHVHPGAIRAALRAIPGLYCVSDATAATGMPDGEFRLGRQRVSKCLGAVRLADGTLAGSALTLHQALRNLVGLGLSVAQASARVSTQAASYLGLADRGRLAPGAAADLVALDPATLTVARVVAGGQDVT